MDAEAAFLCHILLRSSRFLHVSASAFLISQTSILPQKYTPDLLVLVPEVECLTTCRSRCASRGIKQSPMFCVQSRSLLKGMSDNRHESEVLSDTYHGQGMNTVE